ncbi:hypothetical protein HMPREF9080_00637 [Cardiobacterium valvarum F0432]|uniref:Uncharacterized protein n=1 Tax=Cardiobacterium valvarum F0432 TaxID=797473 RepID=G9ZD04_9GAMM|nr:hypothetical protein HMPREF9080_00637 [Cardiobacterium valvarum F0432]
MTQQSPGGTVDKTSASKQPPPLLAISSSTLSARLASSGQARYSPALRSFSLYSMKSWLH